MEVDGDTDPKSCTCNSHTVSHGKGRGDYCMTRTGRGTRTSHYGERMIPSWHCIIIHILYWRYALYFTSVGDNVYVQ